MKNRYFQSVCLKIDKIIPTTLTKYLYYPSYLVFNFLCRISFGKDLKKTYLRNSFYLNYFTFGLSDYDFGIILHRRVTPLQWKKFIKRFDKIKRIFPFWGEINLYTEEDIDKIIPFINPVELKRDPFLSSRFKRNASNEEKFTFLCRSFFTNLKNWEYEIQKQKKIKAYFELCHLEYKHEIDVKSFLVKNFSPILKTETQRNFPDFILPFHQLFLISKDILWEEPSTEQKVLMPHYYLWFEREPGAEEFLAQLNPSDKEIIKSQMKWEVWGLTIQFYHFLGAQNYHVHLSRVKRVLEILNEDPIIIKDLEYFLDLFNHFNQTQLN